MRLRRLRLQAGNPCLGWSRRTTVRVDDMKNRKARSESQAPTPDEPPAVTAASTETSSPALAESPELARGVALSNPRSLLESLDSRQLQEVAVSQGLQALWQAVLPMVGIVPARPNEYAGVFKVEPGPGADEATIYVDIASDGYEPGRTPNMERVVALTVKLSHDYRLLGEHYYCVDCDPPRQEMRH